MIFETNTVGVNVEGLFALTFVDAFGENGQADAHVYFPFPWSVKNISKKYHLCPVLRRNICFFRRPVGTEQ